MKPKRKRDFTGMFIMAVLLSFILPLGYLVVRIVSHGGGTEEVLAILRSHPEEERNDRLKALAGGRPYRSVLDVLYPQLRDACYIRVQYANRPDSVADTVNRAIEAIRGRKYEEAFRLLKTVEADERSWNVRGVCHLLCGDDKEAGLWLHRAVKAGNREAEENLKKMNAERRAATIGITQ